MTKTAPSAGRGLIICLLWIAAYGCAGESRVAVNSTSVSDQPVSREASPGPELDCEAALQEWRSFRLEKEELADAGVYDQGFLKGCTGPPGLVDGAPDYNLGHSDGMLAAMGRKPGEENIKLE